jgi:tricorn protease
MKRLAFRRDLVACLLLLGSAGGIAAAAQPAAAQPAIIQPAITQPVAASPVAAQPAALDEVRGYYQSPTLQGSTLVFASEGDLWRVPVTGGTASRLTSHATAATEPRISPDGRWLAFTGRFEGSADVYVMPLAGGPPRRLTHEGDDVRVQGWTPEGSVLYATAGAVGPSWYWLLRSVHPETLEVRELPLADAREGTFDGAGHVYFTRFGLDVTGDNARTYRGGAMAQLWRFRLDGGAEAVRLAAGHEGSITRPMWWDGQLYVVSDADGGIPNIWRMDANGGNAHRLTAHRDFEVRGATLAGGRIVYQHGADIRLHDIATGSDAVVDIRLGSDRSRTRTRWIDSPMSYVNSISLAPKGDHVALTARGQLALAGTGELRRIEIALPPASRARQAVVSPDGASVYAFVDAGGDQEIWRFPADGRGPGEALTSDAAGHRVDMHVSPDGRWIAHHDRTGRLWLLDTRSRSNRQVDSARGMTYRDVAWSPDSRTLALVRSDTPLRRPQVVLYDVGTGRAHVVTSDRYESYSPAFSPDGRWLWFLSDRNFVPTPGGPWGDRNLGPVFDRRTRIYALALQRGNAFPLEPRTELTQPASSRAEPSRAAPRDTSADSQPARGQPASLPAIQYDGLAARLHEVPVRPGNFSGLLATGPRLYVMERATGEAPALRTIELEPDRPRIETFGEGITYAELSADRSRLLIRRGEELLIVQAGRQAPTDVRDARVRVTGWRLALEPLEEWQQMFVDAWRMQRDYLFDPEMRGTDWAAVRDRYLPLVERVSDRRELDDVLRQMVAELGVLHSQVRGGEYPDDPEAARPSFLGGTFEQTPQGARVTHIYRTDPELPGERAPLAAPGVELRVGDVITAVNGRAVNAIGDMSRLLSHQAGEQVRLDYLRDGAAASVIVRPVNAGRDAALRYSDWVAGRREAVDAASAGRVGYLHLRAMGAGDMADFAREFYANLDRDALIIDVRRNRGGNIDAWVIGSLLRRGWSFWQPTGQDPYWNMQQSFRGHLVVLIDPLTYSDGETFAAGVKSLGLGPLVGQRTAGAGVWLSDTNRLVDQGLMRAAQTPQYDQHGRWIIEGYGVAPDIDVENAPHATWRGEDAQLQRGIAELLRMLEAAPVQRPAGERIPPLGTDGRDVPPPGGAP